MTPEERFERHEQWLEQHDRSMAEHERVMRRIDGRLNRAIRLAVREARAERLGRIKANAEFDEKMTQLAAAQLVTEEKLLQDLIEALKRGGNGHTRLSETQ
jgi:hypothetical protein